MQRPQFRILRIFSIPMWLAIHYLLAATAMFFAAPSPSTREIEHVSQGYLTHNGIALIFLLVAIAIILDVRITPNRFLAYLTAWFLYVVATIAVALMHLLNGVPLPGIYLAVLSYIGEMLFLLLSYSVLGSVSEVAERIATMEPYWRRLLSKTDLGHYDRKHE